ncbi:hypothetical protein ACGFZS_01570 [Streptomyces sp. NPDC048288]|uniref:hypothetical protein n=1 Tax=Streptomyces sp. NPDC048288 TaxID=3365529 RepID=UPI0037245FFD
MASQKSAASGVVGAGAPTSPTRVAMTAASPTCTVTIVPAFASACCVTSWKEVSAATAAVNSCVARSCSVVIQCPPWWKSGSWKWW